MLRDAITVVGRQAVAILPVIGGEATKIVLVVVVALDINCLHAQQHDIAKTRFRKLLAVWVERDIKPRAIYDMDETGFRIGTRRKAAGYRSEHRLWCMAACTTNREFMTVVECVSAKKEVLPPLVILLRKKVMELWIINTDWPHDFFLTTSDTDYSNDDLSLEWLKHFEQHSPRRQEGKDRLLILDRYESHCNP